MITGALELSRWQEGTFSGTLGLLPDDVTYGILDLQIPESLVCQNSHLKYIDLRHLEPLYTTKYNRISWRTTNLWLPNLEPMGSGIKRDLGLFNIIKKCPSYVFTNLNIYIFNNVSLFDSLRTKLSRRRKSFLYFRYRWMYYQDWNFLLLV